MWGHSACIRHVRAQLVREIVPSHWFSVAYASTDAKTKPARGAAEKPQQRGKAIDGRFDAESWWKSLEKMKIRKEDVKERDPKQLAEDAAVAKEYSRRSMRAHRQQMLEESTRLKMKLAAIEALPPKLREVARKPDYTLFPEHRVAAAITPPIEGYSQDAVEVVTKREKRR